MSLADSVALWLDLDKPIDRPKVVTEEVYIDIVLKDGYRASSCDKKLTSGPTVVKRIKVDTETPRRNPGHSLEGRRAAFQGDGHA